MKGGIYCIKNLKNGKKYIGQSVDLNTRKIRHFSNLRGGYHHNTHLQNAWNKYGEGSFQFKVLIYCESFELTRYEQFFVDLNTAEILYNIWLDCVSSSLGVVRSKKARENMSKAKSGQNHHFYGKSLSEEHKKKLSELNSGKNNHFYGKVHPEETRQKISEAKSGENHYMYGKHHSEETKRKLSELNTGKTFSKETRRKMSEAKSGENAPTSKLTEKQVLEILSLFYCNKLSRIRISEEFGVSSGNIYLITMGKTWIHCYHKFMETYKDKGE